MRYPAFPGVCLITKAKEKLDVMEETADNDDPVVPSNLKPEDGTRELKTGSQTRSEVDVGCAVSISSTATQAGETGAQTVSPETRSTVS
jgi:hypothetical protein